eukprot:gene11558-14710_t
MGGGFSTPQLLAAVSNAGGLGSFGAYTFTAEQILEADKAIRMLTDKPYNINLWVSDVDEGLADFSEQSLTKIKELFQPYFDELGIPMPNLDTNIASKFEKQEILDEARRLGIKTVGAATTLDEALLLEE